MSPPRSLPSSRLLAQVPIPMRLVLGFGLLGLCVWLPAVIALFR